MPEVTPLKIAIVTAGMTMRELAARIGKHDTQVVRWANATRVPPLEVQRQIAEVLDKSVAELWPARSEDVAA